MEQHAHPPDLSNLGGNPYLDVLQWPESEVEAAELYSLSMLSTPPPDDPPGFFPLAHEVTT